MCNKMKSDRCSIVNIPTYAEGIHSRTVRSLDAEARQSPPGEKFTSVTTSYRIDICCHDEVEH